MESDSFMKVNSNDATTSHTDKNQLKSLDDNLNDENRDENSNSSLINSSFDLQKSNLSKLNSTDLLNDSFNNSLTNSCMHKSTDKHSNNSNDNLSNSDKSKHKKTLSECLGSYSSSKLTELNSNEDNDLNEDSDVEMKEEIDDEESSESASKESNDDEEDEEDDDDEEMEDEEMEDEEIDDEEVNKVSNKRKKNDNKKRKAFYERKNIKKIIKEKDLDENILNARKEEEERIKRILEQQKILKSEQQSQIKASTSQDKRIKDTSNEDIVLSSDEEENTNKDDVELIELSDTEEVIKVYEKIPTEIDSENAGLHTDDSLNVLNKDGRCLVNIGHPVADPDIFLDDYLAKKVKPHQIGGVRFMYDCIIEDLKKIKRSEGIGCILAHSMGLGKTIQTISFIEVFLRATQFKHVLCIVPVNILLNWQSEFDSWLPDEETLNDLKENKENKQGTSKMSDFNESIDNIKLKDEHLDLRKPRTFKVYSLTDLKKFTERASEIAKWYENGGVLLMGYEAYRLLFNNKNIEKYDEETDEATTSSRASKKPFKLDNLSKEEYFEKMEKINEALVDPGPDLVICDEGHRIKNYKSSTSEVLKSIRTKRRIVLTGYPLQNNLIEYWCMVDFIRPGYLGKRQEFINMFERPIQNGQCVDSEANDRILARKRVHVLHKLLRGFVQRRSFTILFKTLPKKQEYCFNIAMTDLQRELLLSFFEYVKKMEEEHDAIFGPLKIYSSCYKIWNHTDVLHRKMLEKEGLIEDQQSTSKTTSKNKKKNIKKDEIEDELEDSSESYEWATDLMRNYVPGILDNSFKFKLLFKIIEESIKIGDRLLVFTQSLTTLDIIEDFLCQRKVPNSNGVRFRRNQNYFRLDGSTAASDRKSYVDTFNSNPNFHLFLISTKAGSLGINLTGANRLIVLDISWNPCFDAQAVHRIFRYGQTRECFVYRFIFDSSLEKKIFDRQIIKQGMSNQVVDHLNTDANLTNEDISNITKGLCNLEKTAKPEFTDNDLEIYTDPIMKKICKELNYCFTKKPFLHESLLTVSEHNQLSAWEKQLAEREYVIEKRSGSRRNHSLANNDLNQNDYNQTTPNYQMNPNSLMNPNNQTNSYNQMNPNNQMLYYSNQQQMNFNPVYNNSFNQNLNNSALSQPPNLPHQNHSFNQNNFNNQYPMSSSNQQQNQTASSNAFENNSFSYNYNYGSNVANNNQQTKSNALVPVSNIHQSQQPQQSPLQQPSQQQQQNSYAHNNFNRNTYQNSSFNSSGFIPNNLRREKIRVTQRNFTIPQDLRIKDEANEVINLRRGQIVLLIQSENSLILRTMNGKQVQIRGPFVNYFSAVNNLQPPQQTAPAAPMSNMRASTSHSNSAPEVISLSDED